MQDSETESTEMTTGTETESGEGGSQRNTQRRPDTVLRLAESESVAGEGGSLVRHREGGARTLDLRFAICCGFCTRERRQQLSDGGGGRGFVVCGPQEMKDKGVPFVYRFRVPENELITINDIVRGEVTWNTDTVGDFVLIRSNGLPVYNFCVAIDDATMGITHVRVQPSHPASDPRPCVFLCYGAEEQP